MYEMELLEAELPSLELKFGVEAVVGLVSYKGSRGRSAVRNINDYIIMKDDVDVEHTPALRAGMLVRVGEISPFASLGTCKVHV